MGQGTRGRDHPGQGRAHGSGVGSTRARVGPIGPKEGKGSKESSMGCIPRHTLKTVASRSLRGALALDSRQSTMELHIALLLPLSLLEVLVVLLGSQIKRSIHRATT